MLSTYVRYLAWLGTAPQSPDRQALNATEPVTRLAKMEQEGLTPSFPACPAHHIIQYLMEMGPVEPAGMDFAPISWTTMHCWQGMTGITLKPWEARLIRQLSIEYLDETRKARKPDCPSPWTAEISDTQREAVSAKIRSIFGGLARNRVQA